MLKAFYKEKHSLGRQFLISLFLVVLVSGCCYTIKDVLSYKIIALILLTVVSVIASLFDILPVLCSAIISALILNFFFIPPYFTFHIDTTENVLLFFVYLLISLVNAVLTFKIRNEEKKTRDKEEKEKTIVLYNTLLNSLSHELRTPISTIVGAVDTLKENKERLSDKQQNELLDEIDIASLRLNRQVENLLNISRLESGILKLKRDWTDINELIHSVINKFSTFKKQFTIHFSPNESLPLLNIDRGLLGQVLFNIIHNAIVYTPEGSVIDITAEYVEDQLMIEIKDDGYGFPEKEIANVFNKFYRLPNSVVGGSGLGLSIAKGYVEAHNGTITLKNIEKSGACFTISIPAEASYLNFLKNE